MDWFQFTPGSVRYVVSLLIYVPAAVFLVGLARKTPAEKSLTGTVAALAAFSAGHFLSYAVHPAVFDEELRRWSRFALWSVPTTVGSWCYVRFGYDFLEAPYRREGRRVLQLSGAAAAALIAYAFHGLLLGGDYWLAETFVTGYVALLFSWASVVLVRKARRGDSRQRQAFRGFAALNLFMVATTGLSLVTERLMATGLGQLSESWRVFDLVSLAGNLAFVAYGVGLIVVYVNHAPRPVSFQVRLVAIPVATMLAMLAVVETLAFSENELRRTFGPPALPQETLVFTPEADGYTRTVEPARYDETVGERLDVGDDRPVRLETTFPFPFFGGFYEGLTVSDNGTLFLGTTEGSTTAEIAALRTDLMPMAGGRVFFRGDEEAMTVTWHAMPEYDTSIAHTIQAVLFRDGRIELRYPDGSPTPVDGYRGIGLYSASEGPPLIDADNIAAEGGLGPPVAAYRAEFASAQGDPTTGTALFERLGEPAGYAAFVHHRLRPLVLIAIGSTLFALLLLPLFFRTSLIAPIRRLREGVQRVNDGDLHVHVPVGVEDELGHLARHFNAMIDSLRRYSEEMEQLVAERTAEMRAQAKRLSELDEAKSRFFANISHEFRTPLTLIRGPIEDVRDGRHGMLPQDARAGLDAAVQQAHRLQTLIDRLLALARLDAGKLDLQAAPVDFGTFVRRTAGTFESLAIHQNITLEIVVPERPLPVYLDAAHAEEVVTNLLSNAFKFTPTGGCVRVGVHESDATWVELRVTDSGPGIEPDRLPHLFDRFYQADDASTRRYEGSGIGLALVRELVALHGGEVRVESALEEGSTFVVRFRRGKDHLAPHQLVAHQIVPEHAVRRASEGAADTAPYETFDGAARDSVDDAYVDGADDEVVVLVVDDNADLRAYLREHLGETYRVLEAPDGVEALAIARDVVPDLVVSDVMMPAMDGFDLCTTLKSDVGTSHVPVVLLTARADDESRLSGLESRADDYLAKPFSPRELRARVGNLIEQRRMLRARFSTLTLSVDEVDLPSREVAFLQAVEEAVTARIGDSDLSIDDLAEALAMSRRQFHRKVKNLTGVTPNVMLRRMRLERAADLLRSRTGTVTQVAYAVGFSNPSYFSKLFREHHGVLPSEMESATT